MLRWTLLFLISSIIVAVLWVAEIAESLETVLPVLYFIFTALFLISLVSREIALTKKLNENR